jgi:hypothetical protein
MATECYVHYPSEIQFEFQRLSPRMGQPQHSPGQSVATVRREAPPWVLQNAQSSP